VILEESLRKLEADHSVLSESVSEHERTLADVQVLLLLWSTVHIRPYPYIRI